MLSFKEFLSEGAVDKEPNFKSITMENAVRLVKGDCSIYDRLGVCFYRGERKYIAALEKTGFAIVDPSASTRTSQNTSNHYTVIFDNHPEMKDFPKRSRSFIASLKKKTAENFTNDDDFTPRPHNVYVLIPFDNVKIGVCPGEDMWDTKIKLFGGNGTVDTFNDVLYVDLEIGGNITEFEKFGKLLKDGDEEAMRKFSRVYKWFTKKDKPDQYAVDNFMQAIWDAYSPKNTKLKAYTSNNIPADSSNKEVWIGGKCIAIEIGYLKDFEKAYFK